MRHKAQERIQESRAKKTSQKVEKGARVQPPVPFVFYKGFNSFLAYENRNLTFKRSFASCLLPIVTRVKNNMCLASVFLFIACFVRHSPSLRFHQHVNSFFPPGAAMINFFKSVLQRFRFPITFPNSSDFISI